MVQAIEIKFKFFGEWEMGVAPGRQNRPQEAQEAPGEPQDTKTSPRTPYVTRYVVRVEVVAKVANSSELATAGCHICLGRGTISQIRQNIYYGTPLVYLALHSVDQKTY